MGQILANISSFLAQFVAGERCLLSNADVPEHLRPLVRAEQINNVSRLTPAMMAGNISNATVIAIAASSSPNWMITLMWAILLGVFSGWMVIAHRRKRGGDRRYTASRANVQRLVFSSLIFGLLWALMPFIFLMQDGRSSLALIIAVPAAMVCISAFALASVPVAAVAFSVPVIAATLVVVHEVARPDFYLIVMLTAALAATLLCAICAYFDQIARKIIDQAAAEESARTDPLTGLLNRKGFEEFVASQAIAPMKRFGTPFAIMMLDLDNFKTINDTYGHAAGDHLLQRIAERLVAIIRPEDCVARLGGDEFVIVCRNIECPGAAGIVADRIIKNFDSPLRIAGDMITCRTSIGIAIAPLNGRALNDLLHLADKALYSAKDGNRGEYHFADEALDKRVQRRRQISEALRSGLDRKQFHLDYQPIFGTRGKRLSGFEALLRWTHPELGAIGPSEFIPVAEQLGLIPEIGEWVIDCACKALQQWPDDIRISVNVSPSQLSSPALVDFTMERLRQYGLPASRLEIEITESVSIKDSTSALAALDDFRAHGIGIALDDFGTGYSSMTYVCKLPVTRVKIDRSFVSECFSSNESLAVIQAIIGLAHSINLDVVAEGVETIPQYHMLAGMGCEEIQGYLLSRPLLLDAATDLANRTEPLLHKVA